MSYRSIRSMNSVYESCSSSSNTENERWYTSVNGSLYILPVWPSEYSIISICPTSKWLLQVKSMRYRFPNRMKNDWRSRIPCNTINLTSGSLYMYSSGIEIDLLLFWMASFPIESPSSHGSVSMSLLEYNVYWAGSHIGIHSSKSWWYISQLYSLSKSDVIKVRYFPSSPITVHRCSFVQYAIRPSSNWIS